MLRLKEKYKKEVIPAMMEKFDYKNILAVPKIKKVIVNTGFGRMIAGKSGKDAERIFKDILGNLALISGQHPVLT